MLIMAIQKAGRLHDNTRELLREAGILFTDGGTKTLKITASNFPLQLLALRDDDIPECVADGVADVGIVGENICLEKERPLKYVEKLGFARCRLSIAVPKQMGYTALEDLNGLNIATSYPHILRNFLVQNQINASIHEISGSVEIAPSIGLADAIFDIVSTGSTIISNGLKEVETVMRSEAVLVANNDLSAEKLHILDKLLFRIRAVNSAQNYKYILLNAPNSSIETITTMIPGMKSPSILPLALEGWSSLHSVVKEDDFWEVIEKLQALGAQGILVIPIEKMIV